MAQAYLGSSITPFLPAFRILLATALVLLLWSPPGHATAVSAPPIGAACAADAPARQEVRDLTADQWNRYIVAVKTLQARATPETASAYDQLAFLHAKYSSFIHSAPEFFPWHRLFVRTFEYDLQQIDPTVAVPYWDWTRDSQRLAGAPFWSARLLGGNGGRDDVIGDGQFATWVPEYSESGFRRGGRTFGLQRHWSDPTGIGTGYAAQRINAALRHSNTYDAFRQSIEGGAHNRIHNLIGGDMGEPHFSPNDPVFWMHHAFIDKLWGDWQSRDPEHLLAYGGKGVSGPATAGDRLDGYGDVTVRDVLQLSSLCVKYDTTTPPQATTTTLRTSAAAIKPRQDVIYIATVSRADGGTVDFTTGGQTLCRNVAPVFAVNTWTASCTARAAQVRRGPGKATVVADYSGDRTNRASAGTVSQRVVRAQPTVLWNPAADIGYGTPLSGNVKAFASAPGRLRFTVLDTASVPLVGAIRGEPVSTGAPESRVRRSTVLGAGYHVLLLRYAPRRGPPQRLTRQLVVRPGTLSVRPEPKRITTQDPTPPLTYVIDGFVAGDDPDTVLSGFLQPTCRATRPDGASETAPRPAGTYQIFCEGGNAPNYLVDTSATATLEVVNPSSPTAGASPTPVPPAALGAAPPRLPSSVCSTFLARGVTRLYCGAIKRRPARAAVVVKRKGRVIAQGQARRRGRLLELTVGRVAPGRYRLTLATGSRRRRLRIRVIAPAQAQRASAPALFKRRPPHTLAALCRLTNVNIRLGPHRWRVVQTPH